MVVDPEWAAADAYFEQLLIPADPALDSALRASSDAGLPEIQVSPLQGKLLHLLAQAVGARRILEVGTLGGYSTIWLARALPRDGRLVSVELDPHHAEVARANLARAGVADRVQIRVGRALDLLEALKSGKEPPFDFAFIDADKPNVREYFDRAVGLLRPYALIVVDNVVRGGAVRDASNADPNVRGTRRLLESLPTDSRTLPAVLQTVGLKGHDGWLVALVRGDTGMSG
jgi:predicted O-methyltransferase YrrM